MWWGAGESWSESWILFSGCPAPVQPLERKHNFFWQKEMQAVVAWKTQSQVISGNCELGRGWYRHPGALISFLGLRLQDGPELVRSCRNILWAEHLSLLLPSAKWSWLRAGLLLAVLFLFTLLVSLWKQIVSPGYYDMSQAAGLAASRVILDLPSR